MLSDTQVDLHHGRMENDAPSGYSCLVKLSSLAEKLLRKAAVSYIYTGILPPPLMLPFPWSPPISKIAYDVILGLSNKDFFGKIKGIKVCSKLFHRWRCNQLL